jgi:hypothetical protein
MSKICHYCKKEGAIAERTTHGEVRYFHLSPDCWTHYLNDQDKRAEDEKKLSSREARRTLFTGSPSTTQGRSGK